jgi:hypothetical protein
MSEQEIQRMFEAFGLGKPEQREFFRKLEAVEESAPLTYTFIELDSSSDLGRMEEQDAQLARAA